jgi:guanylate kinase
MRDDVVSVFILPPSIEELQSRLKRRAEDADEVILRRLRTAETEITHWDDYDFVLINDDLERCFRDLKQVLVAERLKRHRQPHLSDLTEALLKDLRAVLS